MKKISISLLLAVSVSAFFCLAHAELKSSDLGKQVVLTEKSALLGQIDTISLYLSSDRIALAPRLTKGGVIEVEATILAPELIKQEAMAKDFAVRIIHTFNSVLKERLPVYAPQVAKAFNSDKDVAFIVNAGVDRRPLGVWKNGGWVGDYVAEKPQIADNKTDAKVNEARAKEAEETKNVEPGRKGCNCPARR